MMKNFEKLKMICLEEIEGVGIEYGEIIEWKINSRAKSRWGLCKVDSNGHFIIEISQQLLEEDSISEKACKETIIHEIIHTCKGCMKHTGKWKQYADIMNKTYGYNIKRVTSCIEKGIAQREIKYLPPKYYFICKKCGQRVIRKKESKFTRYYRNYTCGICNTPKAFRKVNQADLKATKDIE